MARANAVWTISPNAQIGRRLGAIVATAPGATHALAASHAARGESRAKGTTLYTDRTGNLRGGTFGRADGNDIIIGATAEYAIYVHEGTRYMSARPFLREAAEETAPEYFEDVGRLYMRLLGGGGL